MSEINIDFKKLTMVEAILYAKEGFKVKLPEWYEGHYLYSDGQRLFEKNMNYDREITDIKHPWKVRKDWQPIEEDNGMQKD